MFILLIIMYKIVFGAPLVQPLWFLQYDNITAANY